MSAKGKVTKSNVKIVVEETVVSVPRRNASDLQVLKEQVERELEGNQN